MRLITNVLCIVVINNHNFHPLWEPIKYLTLFTVENTSNINEENRILKLKFKTYNKHHAQLPQKNLFILVNRSQH